jgi:hypothetical protein
MRPWQDSNLGYFPFPRHLSLSVRIGCPQSKRPFGCDLVFQEKSAFVEHPLRIGSNIADLLKNKMDGPFHNEKDFYLDHPNALGPLPVPTADPMIC